MPRPVHYAYRDPLDEIWLTTASRLGLQVQRSADAYASTDGRGTLILSDDSNMDADDCLAQMILHEVCHWLIQGAPSIGWVDWGLDNEGSRDTEREHACLRLQAELLAPYGLRRTLAPTTDFRRYYDALPEDPFEEREVSERESIVRARAALQRVRRSPFRGHLEAALAATEGVLRASAPMAPADSLASTLEEPASRHPTGLLLRRQSKSRCADCAWHFIGGPGKAVSRCRQAEGARTLADNPACVRFEKVFDCLSCGACCREAYDTVEVSPRDPAKKRHLALMVERAGGHDMARQGFRCVALRGGQDLASPRPSISGGNASPDACDRVSPRILPNEEPFTCAIYSDRPQTCRDFTIFSDNCLEARRSVGLSR